MLVTSFVPKLFLKIVIVMATCEKTSSDGHLLRKQVCWFNMLLNPLLPEVAASLQSQQSGMHVLVSPELVPLCGSARLRG